jgi:formylglycine-generating enzyme required for sulfatase activity
MYEEDASAPDAFAVAASPPTDAAPAPQACPEGEVWIPPTTAEGYLMGKGIKGEHRVVLTHGFCLDAGEVTVREYLKCVEAGACKEPWRGDPYSTYPSKPDYPVNMVSWTKAHAYCAWAGKRLPTEAEWEWAATGPDQTRYPWGDEPEPSCEYVDYTKFGAPKWAAGADVGCGGGGPSPVGSHPKGDKVWPAGALHDMSGNVWEWVEDAFLPYSSEPATDPVVRQESAVHGLRGGGWNRSYAAMVVTYRGAAHYGYQVPALGFRCVRGEPLASPSPAHE